MSALRESFVLPCLFLTVALLGGLRLSPTVRLIAPPLMTLVLAMLLVGALARSRAVAPERLMGQHRSILENLSGLVILLTLFAASAQIFNLVIPEAGLLQLLVSVFFLVQLLTTLTAVRDRLSMLRSLAVLLGCAFILRFIALESLYAEGRGLVTRVMTALMEGVTLGALGYQPTGAATGYVAFLTLVLYLVGLILVGVWPEPAEHSGLPARYQESSELPVTLAILLVMLMAGGCTARDDRPMGTSGTAASVSPEIRDAALASAKVWRQPPVPIGSARLGENSGGFSTSDVVSCRFVLGPATGTTPKFDCELPDGEVLKVKYGRNNPELFAEVAATRLLTALGFGADDMFVVAKVKCAGCPAFPFASMRCFGTTGLNTPCLIGGPDFSRAVDFDSAVVERRLQGRRIEATPNQGWAWYELERIDPRRGGASRGEIDAFRLAAVILAHWDNKAANQRLVCPAGADGPDGSCQAPLAIMQDLGATFGPTKLDLANWRLVRVFDDPVACRVSMKQLPFGGATFRETQISEEGRLLILELLEQLSESQLRDWVTGSRVIAYDAIAAESRDPAAWTATFRDKVRQLRDAGPCPSAESLTANAQASAAGHPSEPPSR
jgi:hypothetical protein